MNIIVMNLRSESGDDYVVTIKATRMPKSDSEWLKVIREELPGEYHVAEQDGVEGPGLAGTYVHCNTSELIFADELIEYYF